MKRLKQYLTMLVGFSPRARVAMIVALDVGLCILAVLLAYSIRTGEWRILTTPVLALTVITCLFWLVVAFLQGVYRSVLRFAGAHSIKDLATSCGTVALCLTVLLVVFQIHNKIPRTLALLVPLVLFILLSSVRLILSSLLRETLYFRGRTGRRHVVIYGAGVAGRELTLSIKDDPEFQVAGFIDDNPVLRGRRLDGKRIWHASELAQVLRTHKIDEILIAMPAAPRSRRRRIVEKIRELSPGLTVRSLPNVAEIASGRISVSDLREIQVEELLGRDQVEPDPQLMSTNIRGQCVMISGAGGSIGSELSRQIVLQRPSQIILAERSELALYLIEGELRELCDRYKLRMAIEARLVDVADERDMERVYRDCRPKTVFHAAAYKHVPLVESNPIAGIRNNILGTYNCCVLGEQFGVRNFTLVSTDKAVRPSSVMGASKRVCELITQARAVSQSLTKYSAVRFGNVLGSSGSVVPLFRRQIAGGGPVTITHREATRYFMTVSEAAQLVVQAGAIAQGAEIFLLDMGEPVRIYDLATMMIQLSGLTVAADGPSSGDIEIVEIGLRPGEKLHEELLIDNRAMPTSHPRIVRASDTGMPARMFEPRFSDLLHCIDQRDPTSALAIIEELVGAERTGGASEPAPRKAPSLEGARPRARIIPGTPAFEA